MELSFITSAQVAKMFGVQEDTVSRWRQRNTGPAFYKVGRSIRYDVKEIERILVRKNLAKDS